MKQALLVCALAVTGAICGYVRWPGAVVAAQSTDCNGLTLTWDGERNQEFRLRFAIDNGTPTIAELAARKKAGAWGTLAANVIPEYRVASGRRRIDGEAREALHENGIEDITPEVFEK